MERHSQRRTCPHRAEPKSAQSCLPLLGCRRSAPVRFCKRTRGRAGVFQGKTPGDRGGGGGEGNKPGLMRLKVDVLKPLWERPLC